LEQLTAGHQDAVLEFELVNRDYFAEFSTDRGDAFFAGYPARHAAVLAMQAAGTDFFHLIIDDDGATILGRVNLVDVKDGEAELGYRISRDAAGRGVATEAVGQVCRLAPGYGLRRLRAETSPDNHASRKVLLRNGFTEAAGVFTRDLR
jgi:ribosomal-protein-alanine N-acetyltransferase